MKQKDYQISRYRPHHRDQVLDLLGLLPGRRMKNQEAYFRWKYEENPCAGQVFATVALHRDRVVGFRGCVPTRWFAGPGTAPFIMLAPADLCVRPEDRGYGLAKAMSATAGECFAGQCRCFLIMSANAESLQLALRLESVLLTEGTRFTYSNAADLLSGLVGLALPEGARRERKAKIPAVPIMSGSNRSVEIETRPRPGLMARVARASAGRRSTLRLLQDEAFLAWRYNHPEKTYLFYILFQRSSPAAYVSIGTESRGMRGLILDSRGIDEESVQTLLDFAARDGRFHALSFPYYGNDPQLPALLSRLRFSNSGLPGRVDRWRRKYPVLVRPVRPSPEESDWRIEGLDLRRIENWDLSAICADNV